MRNLIPTLLLLAAAAHASDITVTFEQPEMTAYLPGGSVTFRGVITNNDSGTVDLNGFQINLYGDFLTDGTPFWSLPLSLAAGDSTGLVDLFTVTLDTPYTGSLGPQLGAYDVLGGLEAGEYDSSTQNLLGESTFTVNVAPEPSTTWPLLVAGCGAWIGWRRRRRAEKARAASGRAD
jgi:hypothetical protein